MSAALTVPPVASEVPLAAPDLRSAEAFRSAAQEHRRALLRVALRLLGDEHGAEDAVQEALARAFAGRERFRGDARPLTWLCGVVVNVCRAELRRRRVRRLLSLSWLLHGPEGEPPAPVAADRLVRAERDAALRAALARLPEAQRAALALVGEEGLPAREAAQALGTTEAAVWQAVSRARRALRAALREEDEHDGA